MQLLEDLTGYFEAGRTSRLAGEVGAPLIERSKDESVAALRESMKNMDLPQIELDRLDIDKWQAHHIFPDKVVKGLEEDGEYVLQFFYGSDDFLGTGRFWPGVGLDNCHGSNGIMLPMLEDTAKSSGLIRHYGSHPRYNEVINERLLEIAADTAEKLKNGKTAKEAMEEATERVSNLQRKSHEVLMNKTDNSTLNLGEAGGADPSAKNQKELLEQWRAAIPKQ